MSVIEITEKISETIDKLYDFLAFDKTLSEDFKEFLENNEIEVEGQNDFIKVATYYLFEEKMITGQRVLDYCIQNNIAEEEILNAFKNNFCSVFEVKRISKTVFNVYSLVNEKPYELVSLLKPTNLRGIGIKDFLLARVIEFKNTFYILNIFDVIGSNSRNEALEHALKILIQNPSYMFWDNEEKKAEILQESKKIFENFTGYFKKDTVITSNYSVNNLVQGFEKYYKGDKSIDLMSFVKTPSEYAYFKTERVEDDDFLKSAIQEFNIQSSYDVGLFASEASGLWAIPFLGTFEKIFEHKESVSNYRECVLHFLTDDGIPVEILKRHENALEIFNETLEFYNLETVSLFEELVVKFKKRYLEGYNCSKIMTLYNSKVFEEYINFNK